MNAPVCMSKSLSRPSSNRNHSWNRFKRAMLRVTLWTWSDQPAKLWKCLWPSKRACTEWSKTCWKRNAICMCKSLLRFRTLIFSRIQSNLQWVRETNNPLRLPQKQLRQQWHPCQSLRAQHRLRQVLQTNRHRMKNLKMSELLFMQPITCTNEMIVCSFN